MTTLNGYHTNGTHPQAAPAPVIERVNIVAEELDLLDSVIADLSLALADAALARQQVDAAALLLERIEAAHVLTVEGKNETERRARLTLALADDGRYEQTRQQHAAARYGLADAERRAELCRQRARLLRLSVCARAGITD